MPNKIVKKTSSAKRIAALKAIGDEAALEESQVRSEDRDTNPVAIAAFLPAIEAGTYFEGQAPEQTRASDLRHRSARTHTLTSNRLNDRDGCVGLCLFG